MSNFHTFILENDDDTYIYGGLIFSAEFKNNAFIEPFIHKESDTKIIKYYKSKKLFVVYEKNIIIQLIFTSICWSDDFQAYNIENNIGLSYVECYHGIPDYKIKLCNKDFTEFILSNNL